VPFALIRCSPTVASCGIVTGVVNPPVAPARTFFDGPSCDQVLAFAEPDCNPALVGILARRVGCGLAVDVVDVGASFATAEASIYRLGPDGTCRPDSLVRPMRAYAGGASLSAASFATVARRSFGEGRLRARMRTSSDGVVVRSARLLPLRYELDPDDPLALVQPNDFEFYDSLRRANCFVDKVADDSQRCLPVDIEPKPGRYFEDAACLRPAHLGRNDPACPSSGFVSLPGWVEIGLSLPPITEIRPILGVLPTTPYTYAPDPGGDPTLPPRGTCIAATPNRPNAFYSLADPISALSLPFVSETTE